MEIKVSKNAFFIFDLDDTLYLEREYLYSAFRSIADRVLELTGKDHYQHMVRLYNSGANVFQWIESAFGMRSPSMSVPDLLHHYRNHIPSISLARGAGPFLQQLQLMNMPMGLITDGRSTTQRNKLKALNIETLFSDIIISDEFGSAKPSVRNYQYFQDRYPAAEFHFFGDNPIKDFLAPRKLGWHCYCMKDNGEHIHEQHFADHPSVHIISSFYEIRLIKQIT
ncbi:HAD family hydrolase [Pseudoflavitalea rhizosphaerae]|uniref:HAD family hydrolase n=1 Tax=Pseudoflavitalea rhizosphaerae TaxID=1884793 RepID=UPI000F8CB8F3|nr:HAD family hydrolase [Pseudoflavitalea rhizosphaerae]